MAGNDRKSSFSRPVRANDGRLRESFARLLAVSDSTEQAFLGMGEKLSVYRQRSRSLARQAEEIAAELTRDEAVATVHDLRSLLERLSQYREDLAQTFLGEKQALVLIRRQLEQLQEPLATFRKIVKTLHSLGIATKIESSSGLREGAGVFAFADDLKELSGLIGTRSENIFARLETLENECRQADDHFDRMQAGRGGEAENLLILAGKRVDVITARLQENVRQADRISNMAARFAASIGAVVESIQYQDIVRQKISHIVTALEGMINGDEMNEEVCLLQAAQMQLAREEMEEAGRRITGGLFSLVDGITELASGTACAAGLEITGGTPLLRELEETISAVAHLLHSGVASRQDSAEAIEAVSAAVDDMAVLLDEINFLSEKMKVVALNAAIRASHAGREGAALGVIAESIQKMSREALAQTRLLSDGFRHIMACAAGLGSLREEGTRPETLKADATVLLESLQKINGSLLHQLQNFDVAAADLAGDVRRASETFDVPQHFSKELAVIQEFLQRADGVGKGSDGSEKIFQALFARYTMHSERAIHQAQGAASETCKVIDLQQKRTARPGSELGDNVELF